MSETPKDRDTAASFGFTFGNSHTDTAWSDFRRLTWPELVEKLTSHVPGIKEGSCIVPAKFLGITRKKEFAERIEVAFLDSDTGVPLIEIEQAIKRQGWEAVVSSTHSHMTTITKAKKSHWMKYLARRTEEGFAGSAEEFLRLERGYRDEVVVGATMQKQDGDDVYFKHPQCPKFRVVIPLAQPWIASSYENQLAANAAWKERIEALASTLGLPHDQSCTDTSRLFYLPRRPANGVIPETSVIAGEHCDIFALSQAPAPRLGLFETLFGRREADDDSFEFIDPITGEVVNLLQWVKIYGDKFLIAKALREKRPAAFTGYVVDGKVHIDCPNNDDHTDPGRDGATFIVNADQSTSKSKGFVIHCRHAHCTGRDRLFFVRKMLERGWLSCDDLVNPEFVAKEHQERLAEPPEGASNLLWIITEPWDEATIPLRPWIARGYLMRGAVTVVSGPGSAGKSSLMVAWAAALAIGRSYGRFMLSGPLRVATYNVEDDADEQKRRFTATAAQLGLNSTDFQGRLAILGPEKIGTLLHTSPNGQAMINTPVMDRIIKFVEEFKPDVLILDPFVELHAAEENDNTAVRAVMAAFRTMAAKYNMSIVILHHARKGAGTPGDPDSLRGASSIVGAARVALTLNVMTEEEAKAFNINPEHRRDYFRLDGAKSNYAPIGDAEWFERRERMLKNGLKIGFGDGVAVAWPWMPPNLLKQAPIADINRVLEVIDQGFEDGIPYAATRRGNSNKRWVGLVVAQMLQGSEEQAKEIVAKWLRTGLLYEISFKDPETRHDAKGVKVDFSKRPEGGFGGENTE